MSQAVATRRRSTRAGNGPRAIVMPTKPRAAKTTATAPRATHRFLIDGVSIGDGRPGQIAKRLLQSYLRRAEC